jgi:hypothetical protein
MMKIAKFVSSHSNQRLVSPCQQSNLPVSHNNNEVKHQHKHLVWLPPSPSWSSVPPMLYQDKEKEDEEKYMMDIIMSLEGHYWFHGAFQVQTSYRLHDLYMV